MMLVDYLAYADKRYPQTRGNEAEESRIAFKYLEPYLDMPASEFGAVSLMAVREAMLDATGKHDRPLSRSYINKLVDRIRRALKWAFSRQIIKPDNYTAMKALEKLDRGRSQRTSPRSSMFLSTASQLPACDELLCEFSCERAALRGHLQLRSCLTGFVTD